MDIINELKWRKTIHQQTNSFKFQKLIKKKKVSIYCGIDPTGDSLHIGHLIPLIVLKRFKKFGHKVFILIGGATGFIGDPSGKKNERILKEKDVIIKNIDMLIKQINKIFNFNKKIFNIVNNYDWLYNIKILDFLRDFGKKININKMLNKEVIVNRLDIGISFTEFTYQILQAIDFLYLYQKYNIQLQIGGSDQWGNIITGLELIKKKLGFNTSVFGLTIPLLLKSDGNKIGKTSSGDIIWLDKNKTSVFDFYQFWLNQNDKDVIKFLKYFTFLNENEINKIEIEFKKNPKERLAQKKLANEVTKLVHGEDCLKEAIFITNVFFNKQFFDFKLKILEEKFNFFVIKIYKSDSKLNIIEWLIKNKIESSRRQAREDIKNKIFNIDKEILININFNIYDRLKKEKKKRFILCKSKKKFFLLKIEK